jgi:hypothetical protein
MVARVTMMMVVVSIAATAQGARMEPAPVCCANFEQVKALDGKRVTLTGVYQRTAVRKGPRDSADDQKARTVQIRCDGGVGVMLEVYYTPSGARSDEEIKRFQGKRVKVTGVLRARTPEQVMPGGQIAQTMIGPCIVSIESIEVE